MKNSLVCIALACACLRTVAFAAPPPAASVDGETALNDLRSGLMDSFVKGDVDRLVTYLDPQVVVTWQNGEVSRGPEEVKNFYHRMLSGPHPIVREVQAKPEVFGRILQGDSAVSWGNLHDHMILSDGSDLPFNSAFTIVTARRGERWLVTGYHASVNVFENPVLRAVGRKSALWAGLVAAVVGLGIGVVIGRSRRKQST